MMKKLLLFLTLAFFITSAFCQKHKHHALVGDSAVIVTEMPDSTSNPDSSIKRKLVELALNNPQIDVANANIEIAHANLKKAKSEWLGTVGVSSYVNEFTIINSPNANYYPIYNAGANIPFDIFSKTKADRKVAAENITIAQSIKEDKIRTIKTQVLTIYENYKEQKELVRLQQISVEGENEAYIAGQKDYADGKIQLSDMNRTYAAYIDEQSKLVIKQRDMNVSQLELEQLIGMPLDDAIKMAVPGKAASY